VEIGSGNGEYITAIAQQLENVFFIAIEIKFKRIFKTLKKIKKNNINNILIIHGDASVFVEYFLKNNSIESFIINFPDPWFKKRHKKRRVVNKDFYKVLFDKLNNNGKIYIATDYEEYANIILKDANDLSLFKKTDFTKKWLFNNIFTKYEKNFLEQGNKIFYIILEKANQ
jgi:tRNA (guanine-N7-)-methyltransferase